MIVKTKSSEHKKKLKIDATFEENLDFDSYKYVEEKTGSFFSALDSHNNLLKRKQHILRF